MIDANQRWDVNEAIERVQALSHHDLWWIEEPTSPDDVLGHAAIAQGVAPVGVATGEHCANRVIFKQLLQAEAIGFCQIDSCRLGGVNENLAVMLMAAKFGVPVCPHAGGVGLCEHVQHLSMFDFVAYLGHDGRTASSSSSITCTSISSIPYDRSRPVHAAAEARLQHRDPSGVASIVTRFLMAPSGWGPNDEAVCPVASWFLPCSVYPNPVASASKAESTREGVQPQAVVETTLWYRQPAAQWDHAMPLGNGRLGAMVFGTVNRERIQLNENSLWMGGRMERDNPEALEHLPEVRRLLFAGAPDEAYRLADKHLMARPHRLQSYQTLGDLRLTFDHEEEISDYRRELDLDKGIARVAYRAGHIAFSREVFVSHPDQVVVVQITAGRPACAHVFVVDGSFAGCRDQTSTAVTV